MSTTRSCSRRTSSTFWCLFPHVCLVCSLVVYSIIGAVVFQLLEGAVHNTTSQFTKLLDELWDVSHNSSVSNDAEGFKNVSRQLIVQYMKTDNHDVQWNFLSSLFFCCTVFTTVGYGHLVPVTVLGKVACMVYGAIGIPLMLLVLADLGDILAGCMSNMYKRVRESCYRCSERKSTVASMKGRSEKSSMESTLDSRVSVKEPLNLMDVLMSQATLKRKYLQMRNIEIFEEILVRENIVPRKYPNMKCYSCPELDKMPSSQSAFSNFDKLGEELEKLDVPVIVIVLVVVAYIMLGALIFPRWEAWNTLDAFYFCFVTLTTIGFGDVVPEHPNYFLLLSLYMVIGMAIMCMAFKLMQNRLVCLYKLCIVCVSGGNVTMAPSNDQR
ncbi:potassium channel subfamily K member 18 [Pseudophryne corroboree]|uniref:potassium channel subfamily K member 18 n=1 Tax=Pseudophryne corroboree TaxID=495146 RepID=UPI003081455C